MAPAQILIARLLAGLTMLFASHAQAIAHPGCTAAMYGRAQSSLADVAGSWPLLLKHERTFATCDDGALAEGYSDAVVTNFAKRWDQFDLFVTLSTRHPAFGRWAIQHIDASASDEQLKQIMLNAARCTGDVKSVCEAIHQAAANALTEQKELLDP
jgi:hypothetical protein